MKDAPSTGLKPLGQFADAGDSGLAGRWRLIVVLLCAAANVGWLGAERDRASEGNRLYDAGKYDEAETVYGEGLVDYPESEYLRFDLGAAQYRQGNLTDAIATLEKLVPGATAEDPTAPPPAQAPGLAADAAYNIGNARYRLGKQIEEQDPEQAIALYGQALLAYKRAMSLNPDDEAPKFNHEFVERQSAALKERLAEERQQREQQQEQQEQEQQQEQQGGQEQQEQQQESSEGDEQEHAGEQEQGQEAAQQQETSEEEQSGVGQPESEQAPEEQAQQDGGGQRDAGQEQRPEQGEQHQAGAGAGETGEGTTGDEMTAAEARTLVDAARGEEVDPAEIQRQVGVIGIGEPREDW